MSERAPGTTAVDVRLAAPEEKPALANLFQLYVHDFSEQWAGRDDGELNGRRPL